MPKCPRKVPRKPLPEGLGIIGRVSYSHTSTSDRPGCPLAVTLGGTATHSPGKLREAIQLVTWRRGSTCQPRCAWDVRVPLASEVSCSQQCGSRTPQGGCDSRPDEGPGVATVVGQPGVPQSSEGADGGSVGMGKGPWEPWQSIRDGGGRSLGLTAWPRLPAPASRKPYPLGSSSWWLCRGLGWERRPRKPPRAPSLPGPPARRAARAFPEAPPRLSTPGNTYKYFLFS